MPTLRDVEVPACPEDGVLVRVGATGVCRSDWHAWKGHDPVALPHVPGHELAGVVDAVGSSVTRWSPGDRVTVPFVCGCGRCEYCRAGEAQVCPDQTQPGFTGPGSFAELVAIHAADIRPHATVRFPRLRPAPGLEHRFGARQLLRLLPADEFNHLDLLRLTDRCGRRDASHGMQATCRHGRANARRAKRSQGSGRNGRGLRCKETRGG